MPDALITYFFSTYTDQPVANMQNILKQRANSRTSYGGEGIKGAATACGTAMRREDVVCDRLCSSHVSGACLHAGTGCGWLMIFAAWNDFAMQAQTYNMYYLC